MTQTVPLPQSPMVPTDRFLATAQRRRQRRYAEVSTRAYRWIWFCVALLHTTCIVYYFGVAHGYWATTPSSPLARMLRFYKLGIDINAFRTVAIIHGVVGILHACLLLYMVGCSIFRRHCTFGSPPKIVKQASRNKLPEQEHRGARQQLRRGSLLVTEPMDVVFGRTGFLGVEGTYFDAVHLALELVETALQSYQAYRMSEYVPRPWLNGLFVALLVVNCVCTPLLHRVFKQSSLTRRAICLAMDALLDLVSSVVVPASLIIIYSADYAASSDGFKPELWFNDKWFVNASNEFQLMLVTSWGDLAARVIVSLGFIASLESIKSLVRVRETPVAPITPNIRIAMTDANTETSPPPMQIPLASSARPSLTMSVQNWLRRTVVGQRIYRTVHTTLVSWGILILAFHIHAASVSHVPVCAMQVRPWFNTKLSCALMLLDCYHQELYDLSEDEMHAFIVASDPNRVVRLIVRHCPALVVPRTVQTLGVVTHIKIYNSSIIDWSSRAALTDTHHPVLKTISLVRVRFSNGQLPTGLTDVDFPKHVTSILICTSNLRTLSPDLATRWPQYAYYLFEDSQFDSFPMVLTALNPIQISFANNRFTEFPFDALAIPSLVFLNMAGNRGITSLFPPNIQRTPSLPPTIFINVVNTNVSVLPDWFDERFKMTISSKILLTYPVVAASGTPLYESIAKLIDGSFKVLAMSGDAPVGRQSFVMESTHADAATLTLLGICWPTPARYYPLDLEDTWSDARTNG